MKLTAEQRVQRAHVQLMNSPAFCLYSGIFMLGENTVVDDLPTAATNGRDKFYGRAFIEKLNEKEIKGIILHENLHVAFRQLSMWNKLFDENAQLANIAADYVVNLVIEASDSNETLVSLPSDALLDPKYKGLDTLTVYRMLKQEMSQTGGLKLKTKGNPSGTFVPAESLPDGMDEHQWGNAQSMSDEERQQLAKEVDQALRQGAILAGKHAGNIPREVAELTEAKVDWREATREFIASICNDRDESSWRRPSRRWVGQDVYMPSSISETIGRIVIAPDMSGSIGNAELREFFTEMKSICESVRPEGVELLYWDTRVAQHETYALEQLDSLLAVTKPSGGGGTDPQCIVDYMKKHNIKAECCIVLTDGYVSSWGAPWPCPVLWAITTKDITASVGKSIYMGD